ncbi:MAG: hypothetical protein ABIN83_00240 [Sphingomicrobium sp.]
MKYSNLFRSRWMALAWAAGVVWIALDVAGSGETPAAKSQPTDTTRAQVDNAQVDSILADL